MGDVEQVLQVREGHVAQFPRLRRERTQLPQAHADAVAPPGDALERTPLDELGHDACVVADASPAACWISLSDWTGCVWEKEPRTASTRWATDRVSPLVFPAMEHLLPHGSKVASGTTATSSTSGSVRSTSVGTIASSASIMAS